MPDKTDPAPAEEQPPVVDAPEAAVTPDPAQTPEPPADAPAPVSEPAEPPEPLSRADTIATLIRNGLSNSPISQSEATWQALETRLPDLVAAILEA